MILPLLILNDGGISFGGSPSLLTGHPSVRMTSEVVKIRVGSEKISVDCNFVFTNSGKACKVRMGFPDQGIGASNPDEESGEDAMKTPAKTTFDTFTSSVNGKKTKTELIRGSEDGQYWHAKTVSFAANQSLKVRDQYTQRADSGMIVNFGAKSGYTAAAAYILHTGSSWHGTIGRSEIIVTFDPDVIKGPITALDLKDITMKDDGRHFKAALAPNVVAWKGPGKPSAKGNTLRWVKSNWRPAQKDDIELNYGFKLGN